MNPILSITFGLTVANRLTVKKGLRNVLIGVNIAFSLGVVIGFIASLVYGPDFRSPEMDERGTGTNLIFGFIAAFGAGVAVVIALTSGGANAVVGSAISASLLPPIVNCGMALAMALKYKYSNKDNDSAYHFATVGGVSANQTIKHQYYLNNSFVSFRFRWLFL